MDDWLIGVFLCCVGNIAHIHGENSVFKKDSDSAFTQYVKAHNQFVE